MITCNNQMKQLFGEYAGNPQKISNKDMKEAWMEVNHSVMVVGWGEDLKKNKYWIIRNSYGPNYADNGNFKVERGKNCLGVESEFTTYDVELF